MISIIKSSRLVKAAALLEYPTTPVTSKLIFIFVVVPFIKVDSKYFRPAEVESLLGDATKAKEKLGWEPKITFDQLIEDMCIYGQ